MTAATHRFALAFAVSLLTTIAASASWAAPHAPTVALLEKRQASSQQAMDKAAGKQVAWTKQGFARVAAAAICTEDLATISFQEYSVDWTTWLQQVAGSWSTAMNNSCRKGGLRPSGPMFIEFSCNRDGTVGDVYIDKSSGDKMCDAMQIGTLLRSTPLPAFPTQSRKKAITILCIWSYARETHVATTKKRIERPIIRVSISGATL